MALASSNFPLLDPKNEYDVAFFAACCMSEAASAWRDMSKYEIERDIQAKNNRIRTEYFI
jgi:hypothetical protein